MPCKTCVADCKCTSPRCGSGCACEDRCTCSCKNGAKEGCCK
ncbi:metallothionein-4-like [Anopheles aquasalis]|uniref:Uncharacterized protein n=1 Tax=Anopheles darlingi TaxID=43151 RepID=A0A675B353_ANODA|nr:metallothionein-4-like [Anopheles darlingi]XP_050089449.1 metallothionein-4-like [Anopheles aquasalis]